MRFAEALRAVVSQQLLPEKDEKGRVPAVEILLATPAVREVLRDGARVGEVRKLMADGRKQQGIPDLRAARGRSDRGGRDRRGDREGGLRRLGPACRRRQARSEERADLPMADARRTIGRLLAGPREAGTPAAEAARRLVVEHLEALGYRVTIQRFRFHPSA